MVRPLQTYRTISIIAFTLLLIACILLLLVGLSLPIIKPIYLLILESTAKGQPVTSIATQLRFGVWGVCASSLLNTPTWLTGKSLCFGPQLGYTVPPEIRSLINISSGVVNAVEISLRVILVLHPVAAGLAFITFISSLFLASHAVSIFTLFSAIVTALLGTIVLAVDLALVLVARSEVKKLQDIKFDVKFGGGVWMVLVAVVLTWASVVLLSARACYCCGVR
ncbi:hypothetical protein P691DRAFT_798552 [Macrolepiota fuliginosa MF-IS2]|uniref:Pali-domain-containing protein n=1 Tax=Macrolepiota fuliginosa MF-IS2 TaxID=1400762 RepID=A0A9P5XEW5_9AGAR|nr:hypothetical protein P691DRAFT_798552 [Macrolepiota fuliginosa MF-IS2]